MTNSEQRRLSHWRLRLLHTAPRQRRVDLPALRHFSQVVLQMATALSSARWCRTGGPGPGATRLPAGDAGRGREQDPL